MSVESASSARTAVQAATNDGASPAQRGDAPSPARPAGGASRAGRSQPGVADRAPKVASHKAAGAGNIPGKAGWAPSVPADARRGTPHVHPDLVIPAGELTDATAVHAVHGKPHAVADARKDPGLSSREEGAFLQSYKVALAPGERSYGTRMDRFNAALAHFYKLNHPERERQAAKHEELLNRREAAIAAYPGEQRAATVRYADETVRRIIANHYPGSKIDGVLYEASGSRMTPDPNRPRLQVGDTFVQESEALQVADVGRALAEADYARRGIGTNKAKFLASYDAATGAPKVPLSTDERRELVAMALSDWRDLDVGPPGTVQDPVLLAKHAKLEELRKTLDDH